MEKRSLKRFDLRIPATVSFHRGSGSISPVTTVTKDISSCGVFLVMNPDDMKANEVTVEMALPPARLSNLSGSDVPVRVRASGRVVRIDRSGVAVHFGGSYRFIKKRIA